MYGKKGDDASFLHCVTWLDVCMQMLTHSHGFPPRKRRVATGFLSFFRLGSPLSHCTWEIESPSFVAGRFFGPKKMWGRPPPQKPRNWRRLSLPIPQFFTAPNPPNNIPAECRREAGAFGKHNVAVALHPAHLLDATMYPHPKPVLTTLSFGKKFFCSFSRLQEISCSPLCITCDEFL